MPTPSRGKRPQVQALLERGVRVQDICEQLSCSKKLVYTVKTLIDDGRDINPRSSPGRPRSANTTYLRRKVKAKIKTNPERTNRQLARDHGVSEGTIRNMLKGSNLKNVAIGKTFLLTEAMKEKRLTCSKRVLNLLKSPGPTKIFLDEKIFRVDKATNSRHHRVIQPVDVPAGTWRTFRTKNPASVMVLAAVGEDGRKAPLYFCQNKETINSEVFQKILNSKIVPWANTVYGEHNYVLVQDNAPPHTSKSTVSWMTGRLKFWPRGIWPPNSPDLNVLDYAIFARMQDEVNRKAYSKIIKLKAAIAISWNGLEEDWLRNMCAKFRGRVEDVIEAEGGHIR